MGLLAADLAAVEKEQQRRQEDEQEDELEHHTLHRAIAFSAMETGARGSSVSQRSVAMPGEQRIARPWLL